MINTATVESFGKTLLAVGVCLAVLGAALWVLGRNGGGWLPGDIVVEKRNFRFYFPLMTCIVASLVLSLVAWLLRR